MGAEKVWSLCGTDVLNCVELRGVGVELRGTAQFSRGSKAYKLFLKIQVGLEYLSF